MQCTTHYQIRSFKCIISKLAHINFNEILFYQTVYSRVARVCKKDMGGAHKFRYKWTTFLKSRLNCSVPGEHPFYFNDIQSTSGFVRTAGSSSADQVVYGVFTTPENSIAGSAICAFKLSDITDTFEVRHF